MTTERDPNLLIATWLEEGPRDLPPDTRRAIETAVRTMPQRRLGLGRSWRFPPVNGYLRPTLLVAAILISVVGVAVYGRLRPTDSVGAPGGSPSPSVVTPASGEPSITAGPISGRIAFNRYDVGVGVYGNNIGTFVANSDMTGLVKLSLPVPSDGVAWSPDGTTLLLGNTYSTETKTFRPATVKADGSGYKRLVTPGTFTDMFCGAWSPDGTRLLCGIADATDASVAGIVTVDSATGGDMRRLSSGAFPGVKGTKSECAGGDSPGAWSPDGTQVVFVRHRCGSKPDPVQGEQAAIYITKADGSGTPQVIVAMGQIDSGEPQISWSPDGQWLLFGNGGLFLAHPDGTAYRTILTDVAMGSYLYSPTWSPDGTRIAFSAWRQNTNTDLWITLADGTDAKRLTNDTASEGYVSWTR